MQVKNQLFIQPHLEPTFVPAAQLIKNAFHDFVCFAEPQVDG